MSRQLPDQPDLYAALRASGAAPEDLPALLAAAPEAVRARLQSRDRGLLRAILRHAATGAAIPGARQLRAALAAVPVAPLMGTPILAHESLVLRADGSDPAMPDYSDRAFDAWFAATGKRWGLGAFGEKRRVYASDQFADPASSERRMIHMGIDVFAPAMTPLYAPLPGVVHHIGYNAAPLDYGHTLILAHEVGGLPVYSLYGHLAGSLPGLLTEGDTVAQGQLVAHMGDWHENGGWAPHVHFQLFADMLEQDGDYFGVAHESLWDVWQDICPHPDLVLRLPPGIFAP